MNWLSLSVGEVAVLWFAASALALWLYLTAAAHSPPRVT